MYRYFTFGYFGWKFWATSEGVPVFWQFFGRAKNVSPFTFWPKLWDFLNKWLAILVPMTVFVSLSLRNFGTSNRFVAAVLSAELWAGHYFFGEICSLLIFLNTFYIFAPAMPANSMTSVQEFFVFKQTIKKLYFLENAKSPEPFICFAKVPRQLKEENRALGTRMTISQSKILGFQVVMYMQLLCFHLLYGIIYRSRRSRISLANSRPRRLR